MDYQVLQNEYFALILLIIGNGYYIYMRSARQGEYPLGSILATYGDLLDVINGIIVFGLLIYLSWTYSWYFLLSVFWSKNTQGHP